MAFALARNGCLPAVAFHPSDTLDLVESHRPSVVILDGTESVAATGTLAAALTALRPDLGVLIVHDDAPRLSSPQFPLLPKWDEPELLAAEVFRLGDATYAETPVLQEYV